MGMTDFGERILVGSGAVGTAGRRSMSCSPRPGQRDRTGLELALKLAETIAAEARRI